MRKEENTTTDLEECRDKINKLLQEYNCGLISADDWCKVLIIDNDTYKTLGELK